MQRESAALQLGGELPLVVVAELAQRRRAVGQHGAMAGRQRGERRAHAGVAHDEVGVGDGGRSASRRGGRRGR